MAFQDTDKILVNRGGVDYQADIGPLMGGSVHWDDIEGKPDCFPSCDSGCVTVTKVLTDFFDDYSHPVQMPSLGSHFNSIGYHPDFGWRAIGSLKVDPDNWYTFKPNSSGVLTDQWEVLDNVSLLNPHTNNNSVMAVIDDKLVAMMLDRDGSIYRVEISDGSSDTEQIGTVSSASDGLDLMSKTTYDAPAKTWLINLITTYYVLGDDGNHTSYGGETHTYNEDTQSLTLLTDPKFNGLHVLDQVTVDGSTLYITDTGICDEAGNHTELWGPTMVGKPNNASIKYSPKLNQIVATVSRLKEDYSPDLFADAKNLWVSNDKGNTWTVVDTEPDPTWTGEVVQWTGIDWIPDAVNELGTKGLWVVQSLRGSGGTPEGHLHTLTSGDGINWNFEYGNETNLAFDGKYTSYDGNQFIVVGLGYHYDSAFYDPGERYNRQAFVSDTSTVTIPGIATVITTAGLTAGQEVGGGEIVEIIDSTRFTFKGTVVVGDKACPDTSITAFKKTLLAEVSSANDFAGLKKAIINALD